MLFKRRTEPPSKDNKYYLHTPKGYNKCLKITGDECIPNCVGYCYGRYMESEGLKKCDLPTNNAENWYADYKGKKGKTAKLGAVIVWKKGKIHYSKDGAGHVAFVEHVYPDGAIDTSESAYNGKRWYQKHYNKNYKRLGYQFEGFIYPSVEFEESDYVEGWYKLTNDKYLRKTPEVKSGNKIKVSECNTDIKTKLETKKGYARFNIGVDIYLYQFKKDNKGNMWGRVKGNKCTTWICIYDSTGDQGYLI